uniref:5'-nucleotidase n=1 Tax=Acrobeloides nanus TaxID=290746 RepID=A0A914EL76_9BILA
MKHPEIVNKKLHKIINDGIEQLMFISDFDYTLSRYKDPNGNLASNTPQLIRHMVLDKHPELENMYNEMVKKFHAIEICPLMSNEEKIPYMVEWWTKSQQYTIKAGLSKLDIKEKVSLSNLNLSAGFGDVIKFLFENKMGNIPGNLHIVSNMMIFDAQDNCVNFSKPIIHSFNKNSSVINNDHTFIPDIEGRSNVFLLGDSLGDPHMDVGIKGENTALKIGFLNMNFETYLNKYLDLYDIVIVDDQTMEIPLKIFEYILSQQNN